VACIYFRKTLTRSSPAESHLSLFFFCLFLSLSLFLLAACTLVLGVDVGQLHGHMGHKSFTGANTARDRVRARARARATALLAGQKNAIQSMAGPQKFSLSVFNFNSIDFTRLERRTQPASKHEFT